MDEEQVRQIFRQELERILGADRLIIPKLVQLLDGRNIQVGKTTGTKIGTESTQKLAFLGATPVTRQAAPTTLAHVIAILQAFGLCA